MSKPADMKKVDRAIKESAASSLDKTASSIDLIEMPETPMLRLSGQKISTATRRKLRRE